MAQNCPHGMIPYGCSICSPKGGRKSGVTYTTIPGFVDIDERDLYGVPEHEDDDLGDDLEPAEAAFVSRSKNKKGPGEQPGWDLRLTDDNPPPTDLSIARRRSLSNDPLEIAQALQDLKDNDWTVPKIAESYGVSVSWVSSYLALTRLSPKVQKLMDPARPKSQRLVPTVAAALASFPPQLQYKLAQEILDMGLRANRALGYIRTRKHARPAG